MAPQHDDQEPTRSEIATPAGEVGIIPMDLTVRMKLSVMMFLQYFVWGAWFVSMGSYISNSLGFSDPQKGLIYATSPIGAMVAPFFVGMIADRFFATQRILAVLHLVGAGLLVGLVADRRLHGLPADDDPVLLVLYADVAARPTRCRLRI